MAEVVRLGKKQNFRVSIEELQEASEPQLSIPNRLALGLVLQQITPELARKFELPRTSGLLVVEVEIDSESYDGDIEPGDIILEIDQIPVKEFAEFARRIDEYSKGGTVLLLVDRNGSTHFVTHKVR